MDRMGIQRREAALGEKGERSPSGHCVTQRLLVLKVLSAEWNQGTAGNEMTKRWQSGRSGSVTALRAQLGHL